MVDDDSIELRRLYVHYKNGLLPFDGGLLDQPDYYLQAMELLESYGHKK